MTALLLILPVLSLLVLGAHFYRAGSLLLVGFCLVTLGLLTVRRSWAPRIVEVVLILGAFEWLRTALRIRAAREAMGATSGRMFMILGAVAAVTLLSALLFRTGRLTRFYSGGARQE